MGTALHATTNQPVRVTSWECFSFKAFSGRPDGVTMKVEDMNQQLKFEVRAKGVPKEMQLVDVVDGGTISVFCPTEGSIPSQWVACSPSGQANGAGEKLLTLTKTRVINRHTDMDVMTLNGLERHSSFVNPPVRAGVAYKMAGDWSGRSVVVCEVGMTTAIAEMSQGADKDSFLVNVHSSANTVFVVSLFALANAMKVVGTFGRVSFSFGLVLAGRLVVGIAIEAIGGCISNAFAEEGCECECCC